MSDLVIGMIVIMVELDEVWVGLEHVIGYVIFLVFELMRVPLFALVGHRDLWYNTRDGGDVMNGCLCIVVWYELF